MTIPPSCVTTRLLSARNLTRFLTRPSTAVLVFTRAASVTYPRPTNSPHTQLRAQTMASDEAYMDFLNKANQDADEAHAAAAAKKNDSKQFKTLDGGESEVPKAIRDAVKDSFYVTDADEPFHGVSLKWGNDGLPDEEEFAKLIDHWDASKAQITILDPLDWDSQGQNTKIIEAVREAGKGNDVRVYRVVRDKTRAEYWVVTRDGDRIVGAKALGVES